MVTLVICNQGVGRRHDAVPDVQGERRGGGVREAQRPVPADRRRAAAAAAAHCGRADQLRGASHLVPLCGVPRLRAGDRPNERHILCLL